MERVEEFVAFKGAYEIESLFVKCENYHDVVYRPKNYAILKYCYENYEYNAVIDEYIEKVSAVQEETNILQETMEEELDDTVMKKMRRRAKNKRRKSVLATRAHLLMRVTLQLIHCLISLRAYRRMNV